jgi:GT2 family glycosyltransferase
VDNASPDDSPAAVADLPVTVIRNAENLGFATACNIGWRAGSSPKILFLNPDAQIDGPSIELLAAAVGERVGLAAPRTVTSDGILVRSQRRFVGATAIWAQVLFLHHLFRGAAWADGIVRDDAEYERRSSPDWVSGACMLVERPVLSETGGFDERFFMYCEDMDLCRRIRDLGLDVAYEPRARAIHDEGSSAPSSAMVTILVSSRIAYARKHLGGGRRLAALTGLVALEMTRAVLSRGGAAERKGHLRGLRLALTGGRS